MKKVFSRWLPCVTLALWGGLLLYFYYSGRIGDFLVPSFQPYTRIAGIVMLALAACFAFFSGSIEDCADDDYSSKTFGRKFYGRVLTFMILLAPICSAFAFSSNGYSLSTVQNQVMVTDAAGLGVVPPKLKSPPYVEPPLPTKDGSNSQRATADIASPTQPPSDATDEVPRSKDGNMIVQVVDLLYAARDPELQGELKGQTLEMTGQLMPDTTSRTGGKRFKLVRMFMVCCAADARPVSVLVESKSKPEGPEMSWIKIVGKVEFPMENGKPVAVFRAAKVEATAPPEETMLY